VPTAGRARGYARPRRPATPCPSEGRGPPVADRIRAWRWQRPGRAPQQSLRPPWRAVVDGSADRLALQATRRLSLARRTTGGVPARRSTSSTAIRCRATGQPVRETHEEDGNDADARWRSGLRVHLVAGVDRLEEVDELQRVVGRRHPLRRVRHAVRGLEAEL